MEKLETYIFAFFPEKALTLNWFGRRQTDEQLKLILAFRTYKQLEKLIFEKF